MKKQQMNLVTSCIAIVLVLGTVLAVNSENRVPRQAAGYKIDQSKIYKVMFPKRGYIGSPIPSFVPSLRQRYPTNENHFKTCYVSVTVIAKREHNGYQRIVLRLDEVDENMKLINLGVYHSYIDFLPEGIKIITRCEDDNGNSNDSITKYEIPFPFLCARPPKLGFTKGSSEGQRDKSGLGVKYLKKEKKDDTPVVIIEAERFENYEGLEELGSRTAKWYTSEVDDVVKSKETKILYRENQKWASEGDWLWDEMERFDQDGNILMKCKKIP